MSNSKLEYVANKWKREFYIQFLYSFVYSVILYLIIIFVQQVDYNAVKTVAVIAFFWALFFILYCLFIFIPNYFSYRSALKKGKLDVVYEKIKAENISKLNNRFWFHHINKIKNDLKLG